MFWDIFWGLCLGFLFSAVVEEVVSRDEMSGLLPDSRPRSIVIAAGLGAASSSCSYAAVAMARSMVRKGANFTAAMAFQFAATNLVLEIGVLLIALLGWQFAAAEFIGGPMMIVLLVLLYRIALRPGLERAAVDQAERNVPGAMEGHAQMSMAKHEGGGRARLASPAGWMAISHGFVMNWTMLCKDILAGVLIAGALGAWVPHEVWQWLFRSGHPSTAMLWGAAVGPLIAMATFTCSVGNIPFAGVLWQGGISFGGVIAFIFGDLVIPPLLNIYRKYYGIPMTTFLLTSFYLVMVVAALAVEALFTWLHLVPQGPRHAMAENGIHWNYTAVLNLIFGALSLGLYWLHRHAPRHSPAAHAHH
jgi:uncharacterized membrane protein YraQ (UPF0718 family)